MDRSTCWKLSLTFVALAALTACTQQDSTQQVTRVVTADQVAWSKMTLEADEAVRKGDPVQAEKSYKAALLEAEKLGKEGPAVATTTANLANFYYVQGDGAQADQLYSQSIALREKIAGLENVDIAKDLVGLARVRSSQKKYDDSIKLFERAVSIMKKNNLPVPADVQKDYDDVSAKASGKDNNKS